MLTSSQGEKIQAFVQDSLDAHEEFLKSQSAQGLHEHQPKSGHLEAEQPGQGLQNELREKDNQDKSEVIQPVREENEEKDPGNSQEQGGIPGEMLEAEEAEDTKHPNQLCGMRFVRNATQTEHADMSQQLEMKLLPLVRPAPLEVDAAVSARGPGPLVTEMEDAEQLETIHLPLHRTLRTEDLPDLEEVDTEDLTAGFSSQQVFKPKIEVISGGTDEDEPTGKQSEGVPAFGPDEKSFFLLSGCVKSAGVCSKSSSLVYPEDEDAPEPVGESKPIQPSTPLCCLIEELE